MGEDVNLICVFSGCSVLSLQGHHSFALYLYIVSGWDFIALRQVQLFLFPFFCVPSQHRCCRVRMLKPGSTLTAGSVQSGSKLNQTGFFSFSVHVHASVFSRSQIHFLSSAVCFCNQVTLQNQTMPFILFICRPLPQLLFPPLLSSFPSLLCLPSPPCFTQPTLRTFYSVQNINLSSRGVITLSSRAAAALFKCCLFFFSSICFHFTSLPQYLLPPFLFSPLVSIS